MTVILLKTVEFKGVENNKIYYRTFPQGTSVKVIDSYKDEYIVQIQDMWQYVKQKDCKEKTLQNWKFEVY